MKIILSIILLLSPALCGCSDQEQVDLHNNKEIAPTYKIFIDKKHSQTIDTIQSLPVKNWIKLKDGMKAFGPIDHAIWVKIEGKNVTEKDLTFYIFQRFIHIDNINYYFLENNSYKVFKTGDSYPYKQRLIDHPHYIFPLKFRSKIKETFYFKLVSKKAIILDFALYSKSEFENYSSFILRFIWFFMGLFFALILVGFILRVITKDKSYQYLAQVIITFTLAMMANEGIIKQLFFPDSVVIAQKMFYITIAFSLPILNLFIINFLNIKRYSRKLYSFFIKFTILLFAFPLIPAIFFEYSSTLFRISILFQLIHIVIAIGAMIYLMIKKKSPESKMFLLSSIPIVFFFILFFFQSYLDLDTKDAFYYSSYFCIVTQLILLTFSVGSKYNVLEKQLAEKEAHYAFLFEYSDDIVFTMDKHLIISDISSSCTKHLGIFSNEIKGKHFLNFLQTGDDKIRIDLINQYVDELFKTKKSVSFRANIKTSLLNETKYMLLVLEYIKTAGKEVVFGRAVDITDNRFLYFLDSEKETYVIDNFLTNIDYLIHRITKNVKKYMTDDDTTGIRLAIREVIVNAIEHGNLEITFDEKLRMLKEDSYLKELHKRQNDKQYRDRKIVIEYTLNSEVVSYRITDEGKGFDHKKVIAAINANTANLSLNGRGLIMVNEIFDVMIFNDKGNQILLIKYLDTERKTEPDFINDTHLKVPSSED